MIINLQNLPTNVSLILKIYQLKIKGNKYSKLQKKQKILIVLLVLINITILKVLCNNNKSYIDKWIGKNSENEELIEKQLISKIRKIKIKINQFLKLQKYQQQMIINNIHISQKNLELIHQQNAYQKYFEDAKLQFIQDKCLNPQNLALHKIQVIHVKDYASLVRAFNHFSLEVIAIQREGTIIKYNAYLGKFKLQIDVKNLNANSPRLEQTKINQFPPLTIRRFENNNISYDIQRIYFQKEQQEYVTKENIKQNLKHFCYNKICSLYGIGLNMNLNLGLQYDCICYNDCIEFPIEHTPTIKNYNLEMYSKFSRYEDLRNDLKYNIYVMHHLNLIQGNIKFSTLGYSQQNKRFVFVNYTQSQHLNQNKHQLTAKINRYSMAQIKNPYELEKIQLDKLLNNIKKNIRFNKNICKIYGNVYKNKCKIKERQQKKCNIQNLNLFDHSKQQVSKLSNINPLINYLRIYGKSIKMKKLIYSQFSQNQLSQKILDLINISLQNSSQEIQKSIQQKYLKDYKKLIELANKMKNSLIFTKSYKKISEEVLEMFLKN